MAKALQPAVTADGIFFELERFELGHDDQIRLAGRWFGVRGRRFMRPTLTLDVDGENVRALADLEHKPWAAEDGEPWEAAFHLREAAELLEAELSVAPDITVKLPAPGPRRKRAQRLPALPRRDSMLASWREPTPEAPADAEPEAPSDPERRPDAPDREAPRDADRGTGEREVLAVRSELEAAREELEAAREELQARDAELQAARVDLADAISEHTTAEGSLARALAERDQLAGERDRLAAERDELAGERDRLVVECDQLAGEHDQLAGERDQLAAERQQLAGEGDQAGNELHRLNSELVQLQARLEQATRERDEAVSAHGAALVMRNATREFPAYRSHTGWFRRGLALVVVLGAAIALLILLHAL
jgi:hypothetical protein